MGSREYVDRLKSDYRKAFDTAPGKHVLMDIYTHTCGASTTFPPSGNPFEMAFNEGKRWVWLRILEQLKMDDQGARAELWAHLQERMREENQ